MIGMAGGDGLGAVELLAEQGADQEVRPGHRAQGKHEIGAVGHRRVVAVGAADQEGDIAGAGFALERS